MYKLREHDGVHQAPRYDSKQLVVVLRDKSAEAWTLVDFAPGHVVFAPDTNEIKDVCGLNVHGTMLSHHGCCATQCCHTAPSQCLCHECSRGTWHVNDRIVECVAMPMLITCYTQSRSLR